MQIRGREGEGEGNERKDVLFELLLSPRNNFTNCKPSQSGNRSEERKERIAPGANGYPLLCRPPLLSFGHDN